MASPDLRRTQAWERAAVTAEAAEEELAWEVPPSWDQGGGCAQSPEGGTAGAARTSPGWLARLGQPCLPAGRTPHSGTEDIPADLGSPDAENPVMHFFNSKSTQHLLCGSCPRLCSYPSLGRWNQAVNRILMGQISGSGRTTRENPCPAFTVP